MAQMDGLFELKFILLILLVSLSSETAKQIIIRRTSSTSGGDFFNYTYSVCGDTENVYKWCNRKSADQEGRWPSCSCRCKWDFQTFFSREEKCVNNSYLESLKEFGHGNYKFNLLADFTRNSNIQLSESACGKCKVDLMYFMKDGWKRLNKTGFVTIQPNFNLQWSTGSEEIAGKILKIQLNQCNTKINSLFFLKSNGNYVINITSPTLSPSTAAVSSSMTSTEMPTFTSFSTSTVTPTPTLRTTFHQVSDFVTSPQLSPTKAAIASSYVCSGTMCPSSSSVTVFPPMHPTKEINPNDNESSSLSSLTQTITVVVVVACSVVGGIVALLVVLRRCNSCDRARSCVNLSKTPVADSTSNPMYGHNQGEVISLPNRLSQPQEVEDEEYDYATVDGGHSDPQKTSKPVIYQSLVKENMRDSVYTQLNKEATETPVEYSYNHLQHPQYNPPRSNIDPLYNTLEPPNNDEYMEPGTQISDNQPGPEPVYNVLEGPDANPVLQDNDVVYNVLEDPNADQYPQDNDPVYNVLEGPDDDYDNAPMDEDENLPPSGHDNVAYSSTIDLEKAQSLSSPDYDILEGPEGALPDSMYQPLAVRIQDDVYQPLDRTSQPIYQSLEPNDSMA